MPRRYGICRPVPGSVKLGSLGRTFTVGVRQGQLWLGETPCGVEAVELPVVIA
ncbi:hypothetical protein GS462_26440 [Rhodococcus hoagii]|nr:hypothetical protein [Prescottella equi]